MTLHVTDSQKFSAYGTARGTWRYFLRRTVSNKVFLSICQSRNGVIWAGGFGAGLACIDPRSFSVREIAAAQNGQGTKHIYALHCDPPDRVWVGGIHGDLACCTPEIGK
jgi:hypothetical protein